MHLLKSSLKNTFLLCGLILASHWSQAQILDKISRKVEQKVKERTDRKIDQTIDKGLDKAEGKVDEASRGGNKNGKTGNGGNNNDGGNDTENTGGNSKKSSGGDNAYKGKFDFVPGEKVVAVEDFAQDAVGDFPARWNTNSTGEIVTIDGKNGKWLMMNKEGVFLPEFITNLPENFTLEMDVACNKELSFYSSGFGIAMAALKNQKEFINWKSYAHGKTGVMFWAHPQAAGGSRGHSGYTVYNNGSEAMRNEAETNLFHGKTGKTSVHISIWRQKQRLRVYLDAEKVWDVPRAFDVATKYNSIVFQMGGFHSEADRYFASNIRLAVGAPDTRNKLITVGKFVTSGILFDVNSDKIKPESYGMVKEIANVLNENADVRVKIIGHTDNDGDDAKNLELSKKRAEAVKKSLSKDFGVDAARMETDGKGESVPAVKNDTPENKAQNRRVEFIKL
jgi:OmpA-OmpF porin, OOP family